MKSNAYLLYYNEHDQQFSSFVTGRSYIRQPIDEALKPVLKQLSGTELAALYLGHVELLLNLQRQELDGHAPRGIGGKINLAHLFQLRMEDALLWLARHDPAKARAAAVALRTSQRDAALRLADFIDRATKPAA